MATLKFLLQQALTRKTKSTLNKGMDCPLSQALNIIFKLLKFIKAR